MNRWYLSDIEKPVSGKILASDAAFEGVSIDSRSIRAGELFVALVGDKFDGNAFIQEVEEKKAAAVMTTAKNLATSLPTIQVADTYQGLADLAGWIREQFTGTIVGITGSCGKTTVKEILLWLLESKYKSLATVANYNNEIGVPLTLCGLEDTHENAVIEMGATKKGDIDYTTGISRPNIAVISSIAHAHTASMGNLQQIAQVKGEIFNYLNPEGVAVIPYNQEYTELWNAKIANKKIITFGLDNNANYSATNISMDNQGMSFTLLIDKQPKCRVNLPLWGKHNIHNALAAISVAHLLEIELSEISNSLSELTPVAGRLEIISSHLGAKVIDDTYNANPDSVKAAIDVLDSHIWEDCNKIAILGDMYDLGDYAIEAHTEIGRYISATNISELFTVGSVSQHISQELAVAKSGNSCRHFNNNKELLAYLHNMPPERWKKNIILLKASRNAHLEEIVNFFITNK